MITIPIDRGWMPDLIPFGMPPGALIKAENLLPLDEYYGKAQDKKAYSAAALAEEPQNAVEYKANSGVYYGAIGTTLKLYHLSSTTATDVSRAAGGAYSTGDNVWSFEQFGDWVIATNYGDVIQVKKDMTDTSKFVALGGTPPQGKYSLLHKGHYIVANLSTNPRKIQWAGLEDPESWTQSISTGADSQVFPDGKGDITGIDLVNGIIAVIHESSITTGQYTGAPYTFSFQHNRIKNIGCYVPGSLISIGHLLFFWGEDDIYQFDGQTVTPIGFGVRNNVIDSLNVAKLHKVTAKHDVANGIIWWSYPTGANTIPNKVLAYNYKFKRFTQLDIPMYCLMGLHTGAIDMDSSGYDWMEYNAADPTGTVMPYNMDNRAYQANTFIMSCLDSSDLKVATLNGNTLTGLIETGEAKSHDKATGDDDDYVLMVTRVRPRIQDYITDVGVRIGYRWEENDGVSYSSSRTVGSNGYADVRASGRYLRVEVTTGDHSGIKDIQVDAIKRGRR
ncbi:hypothetical protein LCGC14_0467170 [marine sediment metagenome]|uniref:Uncharacterized protein n=1 Tax=marine sediment metagenome TaxID=412755 RepID=A0A0F9SIJ2_9ZZZZ